MSLALKVRWTLTPLEAPQPWLSCSACGCPRPYRCSGNTRLNANGRRLDAWLIYRCLSCDSTWNRPIFERRAVGTIEPALLEAMHANDPDFIRVLAFDIQGLRRRAERIDEFDTFDLRKAIIDAPPVWDHLQIELAAPLPVGVRLDRLLAGRLPVSRRELGAMSYDGRITVAPFHADALKRRVRDGSSITIDLSDVGDRKPDWQAAAAGI